VEDRFVLMARLKPDSYGRARELIAHYEVAKDVSEFERVAVFLAAGEVVFFFEGHDARRTMRSIMNDPVQSTWLSPWLRLFDGPLHAAPEEFYWERGG
jgi:hypothetical protein